MKKNQYQKHIEEHTPAAIKQRLNRPKKPSVISDAVLGGIDGCVTTFAVISGSVGAGFSSTVALDCTRFFGTTYLEVVWNFVYAAMYHVY